VLIVEAVESGEPRILAKFGAFGRGPGEFIYPTDVAVLTDDTGHAARLYVSEYGDNDRVSVFDAASLTFLFSFGSLGDAIEPAQIEFQRPQSLLIDRSRDRLIVTDACNHRLGVFTLSGTLVRWIGSPAGAGHDREGFAYPYGLAGLADGTVLVSELGNHRVKRVDVTTGATLDVFGVQGRAPGELVSPWGVCVMDERIFVLDSGNDRIQSFRPRSFRASPLALAPSAKASAGGPP
jgi:DNA-binding beta-propeller fold protein YncE